MDDLGERVDFTVENGWSEECWIGGVLVGGGVERERRSGFDEYTMPDQKWEKIHDKIYSPWTLQARSCPVLPGKNLILRKIDDSGKLRRKTGEEKRDPGKIEFDGRRWKGVRVKAGKALWGKGFGGGEGRGGAGKNLIWRSHSTGSKFDLRSHGLDLNLG